MQFRTVVFTAVLAVVVAITPTTNAAECTKDQLSEIEKLEDDPAMDKACPNNDTDSGSFDFERAEPKNWTELSPCKDVTCVAFLKAQAAKVPDCEVDRVSIKTVYADKVTLCVDLASGKLSAAEIEKRIGAFVEDGLGSDADDGDYSDSEFIDGDPSDSGSDDADWSDSGSDDADWSDSGSDDSDWSDNGSDNADWSDSGSDAKAEKATAATLRSSKKSGAVTVAASGGVALITAALAALTAA